MPGPCDKSTKWPCNNTEPATSLSGDLDRNDANELGTQKMYLNNDVTLFLSQRILVPSQTNF